MWRVILMLLACLLPHLADVEVEGLSRVGGWVRAQARTRSRRPRPALGEALRDGSGRCSGPPLLVL
jgi:hypothetical protein